MDKIRIVGGHPLEGTVCIGGAKNAALPLMVASLLTEHPVRLSNLPHLTDIATLASLLEQLGVHIEVEDTLVQKARREKIMTLQAKQITNTTAPYDLVRTMRASFLVLGALLVRTGKARVSLPGGDAIGVRPVDLHIQALEKMGATITLSGGYIEASAPNGLTGAHILFPKVSVGATEHILMAATLAKGETILSNVAREPEIADLADCLNKMGANITGIGTDTLKITGVAKLKGTDHSVIPDRIETGTYAIAAAITGGKINLENTSIDLIPSLAKWLDQAGVILTRTKTGLMVSCNGKIKGVDMMTEPYPGFATDLQAQAMALMTVAEGASMITETIFENRFMHAPELGRMGANITIHQSSALVRGVEQLKGAEVMATDLRASVCLVLAGLAAQGQTIVSRIYHLDRGYEYLEEKLANCGANIERIKDSA